MAYLQVGQRGGMGEVEHSKAILARDLATGALAGQVAGVVMALVLMAAFPLALERSAWTPLQVIGSFAFGDTAMESLHAPSLVAAVLLHQLGPSLLWGLVFGALVFALNVRNPLGVLALALVVGVLSHVIDVNMILPPAYQALHGHNIWAENVPVFWSWAAHLAFGLALMSFPAIFHSLGRYLD